MTKKRVARAPGGEVAMSREEAMVLAAEALLVEASLARRDPKRFFSFCLREERTQTPVVCLPHQRVLFDFVMAHPRCVLRMPVGTSKTFSMAALTLFFLGQDVTNRGAIVSSAQGQATKPLKMVSDYITEPQLNTALRLVFPHLRASTRTRDPWTQTAITVDRPPGIRDPSLVAIGIDGQLPGARLSWCIVDDILDRENTSTVGGRQKVFDFFDSTILARLDHDNPDARLVVTNTPWHPEDLTYRLEREAGWPTLTMDVLGNITLANVPADWDSEDIVPSKRPGDAYRLAAHQPDPAEQLPLWPQRYSAEVIEGLKRSHLPHRFNQLYLCQCRDDEHARCKLEWIEKCKAQGRGKGLVSEYAGQNITVTGVDLAVGQGEEHDYTAFVTLELLPSGKRRILDVDVGRYDGPTTVAKVLRIAKRYKSIVRVENNACFVPGTNVLTRKGYVPIEQVVEGDEVWTHAKRWRKVTGVISGRARSVTPVHTPGAPPILATPNHWFRLRQQGRTVGRKGGHYRPVGEASWVSIGFVNKPAYAEVAVPKWDAVPAKVEMGRTLRRPAEVMDVTEDDAIALGLFMAEGHATKRQAVWTFARHEEHLAAHIRSFAHRYAPCASAAESNGDGTLRVTVSCTRLAALLGQFGKSADKQPPLEWFGWPLATRLAVVRGWLLGDGCLQTNNAKTKWARKFFSASSISKNWMLFAQTALLECGWRPVMKAYAEHVSQIGGRDVVSKGGWTIKLNAEDSAALRSTMTSDVEATHWRAIPTNHRRSNSHIVVDEMGVWTRLSKSQGGSFEKYDGVVYNLVVDEDESYVAEGLVVHNSQDYILQFARASNASVPIKPHTTGRNKAHPEYGVEGIFVEIQNGAWVIPCDMQGRCHKNVQTLIDQCLYYEPGKHTGDALMALWLAREQARELGDGRLLTGGQQTGGQFSNFLSR